ERLLRGDEAVIDPVDEDGPKGGVDSDVGGDQADEGDGGKGEEQTGSQRNPHSPGLNPAVLVCSRARAAGLAEGGVGGLGAWATPSARRSTSAVAVPIRHPDRPRPG